ncbi:MAG TPA: double-stranded DNA-binding protein [Candidatus Bathyarchaeia archaeon]|nr:double-stranded DNA-binding protein [Candidatus Bathyarchaeia archaeon]
MSQQQKKEEKDIEFLKSRKKIEIMERVVSLKKAEIIRQQQIVQIKTDREYLSKYLYDKGEEFLDIAEAQFPVQTRRMVHQIAELIKSMEIKNRISGGELLALFRSVGVNVKINTTIQIEDHGKLVSLQDKLKQKYNELSSDT